MRDDILALDARRRLEYGFRQLEILILQERLAALFTGAAAAPEPRTVLPDSATARDDETADV